MKTEIIIDINENLDNSHFLNINPKFQVGGKNQPPPQVD